MCNFGDSSPSQTPILTRFLNATPLSVAVVVAFCPFLIAFSGSDNSTVVTANGEEESEGLSPQQEESDDDDAYAAPYEFEEEDFHTHLISTHGAIGQGWSLGAGYSLSSGTTHRHGATWLGIGSSVNVARRGGSDLGVFGLLTCRLGSFAHGGLSLEVSGGWGTASGHHTGVGEGGFSASFKFAELGYTFRFPFGVSSRPDWLGGHFASLRVHIPLTWTPD